MPNMKLIAAAALLSTALVAAPSFAQDHGRAAGPGAGFGARAGGNFGGGRAAAPMNAPSFRSSGGFQANAGANVRTAPMTATAPMRTQGMVTTQGPTRQRFASSSFSGQQVNSGNWNNNWNGGNWRFRHHRGFRGSPGFAFGFGFGPSYYDTYAYDNYPYYGDTYAYDDYDDYGPGYVGTTAAVVGGNDAAYCAQRFRSYDPASGTYLGYDGLRHPCP